MQLLPCASCCHLDEQSPPGSFPTGLGAQGAPTQHIALSFLARTHCTALLLLEHRPALAGNERNSSEVHPWPRACIVPCS